MFVMNLRMGRYEAIPDCEKANIWNETWGRGPAYHARRMEGEPESSAAPRRHGVLWKAPRNPPPARGPLSVEACRETV